ncbi:hypothetical protein GOP47_0021622, partial [Adiantum capillus-veneris]
MGGGFMADNKDKTMQQQTTLHSTAKQKRRPQQQDLAFRHSHQALSAQNPNPNPKLPPLLHSSAAPSPAPSLPPLNKRKTPDPPTTTTTSSPPPTPLFSKQHKKKLLKRQKLPSELHQNHHLHQQQPFNPPLQQVKHPPTDPNQRGQKKSQQLSSQFHHKGYQARSNLECVRPNGEQAPRDPKIHREGPIEPQSRGLTNSSQGKCAEQSDLVNSRRYKRTYQEEEARPRHSLRAEHDGLIEQADLGNSSRARQSEQADIENPSCARRAEQGQDSIHSPSRRGESTDEARVGCSRHIRELDLSHSHTKQAEEVDLHRSRPRRLGVQQLDEGAILKRPQKNHQQQEENHSTPYPKRLRSSHQGHQEQGKTELGTPKVQPHNKLPQISCQQHPPKKLTQGSVQGPHGSHQNSKFSSHTSSPHPFPPSTPASMQSSAPSLSTSAVSDEAQKPSKKRKLRSLLEPESIDGQSVAADGTEGQLQVNIAMPAATSAVDLPPVAESPAEILDSKDCTTANSSPKHIHQGPQVIPAKRVLNSILDRLQKKDKFGVFAEPVDPKEVPNYYDIIKDPMDFGTMRNRISSGHYMSIELFQRDIFLICDNAMQYNGKGTVYFRHARAIKDVAERILEDLKMCGLSMEVDETATKSKNGGATRCSEKHDSFMNAGSPSEVRTDNLDDVSGYLFRTSAFSDARRSQAIDENRRNTYALTTPFQGNDSLLTTISGDSLHLVP